MRMLARCGLIARRDNVRDTDLLARSRRCTADALRGTHDNQNFISRLLQLLEFTPMLLTSRKYWLDKLLKFRSLRRRCV